MLTNATVEKMTALRLPALAEAFQAQLSRPEFAELEFGERVGLLIDAKWTAREQRTQRRRLKAARLRHRACLGDISWTAARGLDRSVILSLGACGFIRDRRNLLITDSTGLGKSYLACALRRPSVSLRLLGCLHPRPAPVPGSGRLQGRRLLRATPAEADPH